MLKHVVLAVLVALALAPPAAADEPAAAPSTDRLPRGSYRTTWGPAQITDGPRGRATIMFEDESYISIEPSPGGTGRLIGYWLRPRARSGADPEGMSWARRCDTATSAHPIATRDPRSPWWGTVLVTVDADGAITGRFNSCNGLPHGIASQREGLRATRIASAPTAARLNPVVRNVVRTSPATDLTRVIDAVVQAACGGTFAAPGAFTECRIPRDGYGFYRIRKPIPSGQGYLSFAPLTSNVPVVIDALRREQDPPRRTEVSSFRLNLRTTDALVAGNTLTVDHDPRLCASDLWLVTHVDGRGTVYPHSGLVLSECGPRDGSFAVAPGTERR